MTAFERISVPPGPFARPDAINVQFLSAWKTRLIRQRGACFEAFAFAGGLSSLADTATMRAGARYGRARSIRRDDPAMHDEEMYKWRHQIKNYFLEIKEFRAIAIRCDKTVAGFGALISLVAGVIEAR